MAKNLLIVESPAKSKTIEKFLGKDFVIKASFGHVRDLPSYRLGVDIKNNFAPLYADIKDKKKLLAELQKLMGKMDYIYIATDPDREGEAIAWHIKESLKIPAKKLRRIVFNEITKTAVTNAISHGRDIDEDLVNAQQARRILDRLIGYKLSPILAKKIRRGLSAGRVQSVAVRIICDREEEIEKFVPQEYWVIEVDLKKADKKEPFLAKLFSEDEKDNKVEISNSSKAEEIVNSLNKANYKVLEINTSKQSRRPHLPFITSTLQQEAARKYSWTTKKTMLVAQQLYEGVEVNKESVGLITYMRTDSVRISDEAKKAAEGLILKQFGKEYLANFIAKTKKAKGVQDAHEAIRPAYIDLMPNNIKDQLGTDHFKLYKLIWDRFIASQMSAHILELTQVVIEADKDGKKYFLRANGQKNIFDGFTRLYTESKEDNEIESGEGKLPKFEEKENLLFDKLNSEQKFTQPPYRYTEASLVKELEEKGIGRPSTYSPTISTILERQYIEKEKKALKPTELGRLVNSKLLEFFSNIIDVNFTAEMEKRLDEIMEGKHVWQQVVGDIYTPFEKSLQNAYDGMEKVNTDKPTDQVCEKCGKPMIIKQGRFGEFMACSNYPECKTTKSMAQDLGVKCPLCESKLVERRSKRGKVFYGCSGYPKCKFAAWDKPVQEKCNNCNYPILLVKKNKNGNEEKYCPNCKP